MTCAIVGTVFLSGAVTERSGFAEAATLDSVIVDRSSALLSGSTNFFPDFPTGWSLSTFGPTMAANLTSIPYSASGSFDGTTGFIDFFDSGFPPTSFASGAIEDVGYAAGILTVLFKEAATSDLFVFEASNALLPATGVFAVPVFGADSTVYSAEEFVSAVPLPATGLLLFAAIGLVGCVHSKRCRSKF